MGRLLTDCSSERELNPAAGDWAGSGALAWSQSLWLGCLTRPGFSALLGALATFPADPGPRTLRHSTSNITSLSSPPRKIKHAQSHFVRPRPARGQRHGPNN